MKTNDIHSESKQEKYFMSQGEDRILHVDTYSQHASHLGKTMAGLCVVDIILHIGIN